MVGGTFLRDYFGTHSRLSLFEVQRIPWNTSRYPYLDIQELQKLGKNKSNGHISQMIIYLMCNFSSFPQYFFQIFMFKQRSDFNFEMSGYSR